MSRVFITVDVECHDIANENNYIWGKTDKGEYGLRRILEEAKKNSVPVNFFFDMCECNRYGKEYAEKIISVIREYGQPILLHLHPNYITGNDDKSFLWQYSYDFASIKNMR